jgi:hypothetical protein
VDRCVQAVLKYIGLPNPSSFYKKFLLGESGHFEVHTPRGVRLEYFQIEEVFLLNQNDTVENFIRKIGRNDVFTYSHE